MKVGETLAGRYELRTRVGGGGLGEVFRGFDTRTQRDVTIKTFAAARCPTPALLQYQAQLTAAMGVRHPGVVLPRIQVALLMKPAFVICEAFEGHDLDGLLRDGPVAWPRALGLVSACAEVLAAVAAVTETPHRALKPGNVWICPDDQVKILDYGVAELGVQPAPPRADGTAREYRAPEQIEGEPGDAPSDVFSLGVLLFELIAGVHPFCGATPEAAAKATTTTTVKLPTTTDPVPPALAALISRMLARDPEARIADAGKLLRELDAVKRATGVATAPTWVRSVSMDDPSTGLSSPVVGRLVPAPVPSPTPAPAVAPPKAADEPPMMAVALATNGPPPAIEAPRREPRLAAPNIPLDPLPAVDPPVRPAPSTATDEHTQALPGHGFAADERTEALSRGPVWKDAPREATEMLPAPSTRRGVSDEPTEIATRAPQRPAPRPPMRPPSVPDEATEIAPRARSEPERVFRRPISPSTAQEESTQVIGNLHRQPPRTTTHIRSDESSSTPSTPDRSSRAWVLLGGVLAAILLLIVVLVLVAGRG